MTKTYENPRDYGLPPLTIEEAARVLSIEQGAFVNWLLDRVRPSPSQWSLWKNQKRDLPEALIRLWLTEGRAAESAYQKELRELKEMVSKAAEASEAAAEAAKETARRSRPGKRRRTA